MTVRSKTVQPAKRFSYVNGTRIKGVLSSANPLLGPALVAITNGAAGCGCP